MSPNLNDDQKYLLAKEKPHILYLFQIGNTENDVHKIILHEAQTIDAHIDFQLFLDVITSWVYEDAKGPWGALFPRGLSQPDIYTSTDRESHGQLQPAYAPLYFPEQDQQYLGGGNAAPGFIDETTSRSEFSAVLNTHHVPRITSDQNLLSDNGPDPNLVIEPAKNKSDDRLLSESWYYEKDCLEPTMLNNSTPKAPAGAVFHPTANNEAMLYDNDHNFEDDTYYEAMDLD